MNRWWIYFKERSPLPLFVVVGLGPAWSASSPWSWPSVLMGLVGMILFLLLARMMDEIKDFDKDKIAHPERPLPRGLFKPEEFRRGVIWVWSAMMVYAVFVGVVASPVAAGCYAVTTVYLWLMYKEFYFGHRLADFPLVYAVTHQVIIVPLIWFVIAIEHPDQIFSPLVTFYGLAVLGASMSYEISRKLDVQAHPLLKTYLSIYGLRKTVILIFAFNVMAACAAFRMEMSLPLGIAQVFCLCGVLLVCVKPTAYKVSELLASVSFLVHLYSLVIGRAMGVL